MIFGGIGQEVNNLLDFPFTLMQTCNIFEFNMNIFSDLKVFSFIKTTTKLLTDILSTRALI